MKINKIQNKKRGLIKGALTLTALTLLFFAGCKDTKQSKNKVPQPKPAIVREAKDLQRTHGTEPIHYVKGLNEEKYRFPECMRFSEDIAQKVLPQKGLNVKIGSREILEFPNYEVLQRAWQALNGSGYDRFTAYEFHTWYKGILDGDAGNRYFKLKRENNNGAKIKAIEIPERFAVTEKEKIIDSLKDYFNDAHFLEKQKDFSEALPIYFRIKDEKRQEYVEHTMSFKIEVGEGSYIELIRNFDKECDWFYKKHGITAGNLQKLHMYEVLNEIREAVSKKDKAHYPDKGPEESVPNCMTSKIIRLIRDREGNVAKGLKEKGENINMKLYESEVKEKKASYNEKIDR